MFEFIELLFLVKNIFVLLTEKTENFYDNYDASVNRKQIQKNVMPSTLPQAPPPPIPPKCDHLIRLNLDVGSMVEVCIAHFIEK